MGIKVFRLIDIFDRFWDALWHMDLQITHTQLMLAQLITFFAAVVQATSGFGFALCAVPLITLVDSSLMPTPQILLTLPMTLWMAAQGRRQIDYSVLLWIHVGRFPGTYLGFVLLTIAPLPVLKMIIAVVIILAVITVASNRAIPQIPLSQALVGFSAGFMSMIASIGGPPVALLYHYDTGTRRRANMAMIFAFGAVITIIARIYGDLISMKDIVISIYLCPSLALGIYLSEWIKPRVNDLAIRKAVLILCTIASIMIFKQGFQEYF
jgi:uncharacterized membrane protein YfcA